MNGIDGFTTERRLEYQVTNDPKRCNVTFYPYSRHPIIVVNNLFLIEHTMAKFRTLLQIFKFNQFKLLNYGSLTKATRSRKRASPTESRNTKAKPEKLESLLQRHRLEIKTRIDTDQKNEKRRKGARLAGRGGRRETW